MDDFFITIIISVIASSGFWALIQALVVNRQAKKSVERKALLGLLHQEIYNLGNSYIERGYITTEELENLHYLTAPYFGMNGNGTAETIMKNVKKLPIRNMEAIEDGRNRKA